MESLSKQVLEANEQHKNALDQYTRKLRAELDTMNKLIAAVENLSEDNLQEDPGDKWCLHADGALKPNSIIDRAHILNERSPFFAEALRRERYTKCLVPNPFSVSEKRYLEKAVMKENKRLAALRAQEKGEDAFEAVLHLDNERFLNNIEGINWEHVARDVSASNSPVRTAQECKVRWLGQQHPKINLQRWSEDEESSLHDVVESKRESGQFDWEEISILLETNRTALDCIKHFQASTRSSFRWTNALDNKLRVAVEKYGISNWVLVASSVSPHVSANQCQIRYERSLKPEIKRGRFTVEEDELLTKAIEVHGTDWVKVAQAIPGRTNTQCRARYTLNLTGGHAKEPWDAEEDEKLKAAVNKYGHQWERVREEMGAARPQTQYASRYRTLKRSDPQVNDCPDVLGQSLASPKPFLQLHIETSTSRATASQTIAADTKTAGSETLTQLPNSTGTNPETNREGSDSTTVQVEMAGEPNTTQQSTGARSRKRKVPSFVAESDGQMYGGLHTTQKLTSAKRSRKKKALPPIVEPEAQVDESKAKSEPRAKPKPTSPIVIPSDSGADIDVELISQSAKIGSVSDATQVGNPALIEENMETSQTSPPVAKRRLPVGADLGDLADLEDVPPTKKEAKRTQSTTNRRAGRISQSTLESTATHSMTTRASKRRKEA